MKNGVIYHTDIEWFNFLMQRNIKEVNFWTGRTHNNLNIPNDAYFFFKTENHEIVGMARYVKQVSLTLEEMWSLYGVANGVNSYTDLRDLVIEDFRSFDEKSKIKGIILRNMVKFENSVKLYDVNQQKIQVLKYIDQETTKDILKKAGLPI